MIRRVSIFSFDQIKAGSQPECVTVSHYVLSGAVEPYALFAFPPELAFPKFSQAIPELITYINYVKCAILIVGCSSVPLKHDPAFSFSELFSVYQHELAKKSLNYVPSSTMGYNSSDLRDLWDAREVIVNSSHRVLETLKSRRGALAYKSFMSGYIGFHAAFPRCQVDELEL